MQLNRVEIIKKITPVQFEQVKGQTEAVYMWVDLGTYENYTGQTGDLYRRTREHRKRTYGTSHLVLIHLYDGTQNERELLEHLVHHHLINLEPNCYIQTDNRIIPLAPKVMTQRMMDDVCHIYDEISITINNLLGYNEDTSIDIEKYMPKLLERVRVIQPTVQTKQLEVYNSQHLVGAMSTFTYGVIKYQEGRYYVYVNPQQYKYTFSDDLVKKAVSPLQQGLWVPLKWVTMSKQTNHYIGHGQYSQVTKLKQPA